MIKFLANQQSGRPLIGFGLSRANIERLQLGEPILINLKEIFPALDADITIFFGETEAEIEKELKHLMTDKTVIHGKAMS